MLVNRENLKNYLDVDNITDVELIDDTWKSEEIKNEGDYSSYVVTNTLSNYSYLFNRIFGLKQISNNEFVAFRRYGYLGNGFYYELLRYKLNENAITVSEVLPEEYGWTPLDGDSCYTIVDVSKKRR